MNNDPYSIADLTPDQLEEVQQFERRLSEQTGHTIALIAYDRKGDEND